MGKDKLRRRIRHEMTKWEMPPTVGATWVVWLKWCNVGWQPAFAVTRYKHGPENPKDILENWVANNYPSQWGNNWRKDSVRILPEGKFPKGYKDQ